MTQQTKYDSQEQAAAALAVPLHAIRRAKRQGCSAFANGRVDGVKLRQWLAKQDTKNVSKPKPKAPPTPGGPGAAGGLRRLEAAELAAYKSWQNALAGDDRDEAERLRRGFLEISEALRRADLAVAEAKRDAGELVPRAEVEKALWRLHFFLNAVWMQAAHRAMVEIEASPSMGAQGLFDVLDRNLRFGILSSSTAGMAASDGKIPKWLPAAMLAFWKDASHPQITKETETLAEMLRGAIATPPPPPLAPAAEEVKT